MRVDWEASPARLRALLQVPCLSHLNTCQEQPCTARAHRAPTLAVQGAVMMTRRQRGGWQEKGVHGVSEKRLRKLKSIRTSGKSSKVVSKVETSASDGGLADIVVVEEWRRSALQVPSA